MERLAAGVHHGLTPSEIVECAINAENLGYESFWLPEGFLGDQFAVLTACALATKRIFLGTAISSIFVRSAPIVAMATATVDHFSRGRFILGLGTSHKEQVEPEHGLIFSQPVQRLREYVDIVREIIRDGTACYNGKIFNIQQFPLGFLPYRREIPIYISALQPKMIQISSKIAEGIIPTWCTLDSAKNVSVYAAQEAPQTSIPKTIDIAAIMPMAVADSLNIARDRMRGVIASASRLPRYRRRFAETTGFVEEMDAVRQAWENEDSEKACSLIPDALIDMVSVVGTPDQCRERIQEYRAAGINLPIVSPRPHGSNIKQEVIQALQACAPR
jgi:5,10-methylenetetrahydromethanopterin reductase